MTLQTFIGNFVWCKDGIDSWRILQAGDEIGDCDDFSITVSYLESNKSLIKMWLNILILRHRFYWCKSPKNDSHIILKTPKGWIDNIFPMWRDKPTGHTKIIYWPIFLVALKMLLGKLTK